MKKKILAACLVICLLATAIIGTTLAYFTDTDEKINTFTVGNVDITLTEPNWVEENAVNMYPGQVLPKDPVVTNVGSNPCLVRIKITWPENVDLTYYTDGVELKLGENWTARDGVYYLQSILEPGASTDALFHQIGLSTETENGTGDPMDIVVVAEAVQMEGFEGPLTPEAMSAWFDTCMGE